ncbi:PLP-dependent aminotransferase family protein [Bifidobacterium stellenboschense]|uniref:GntR family transcriptional regulator n=1 Tax=Bifidobacterium stellenboschense TaxID=762211 RepID=A0A087DNE5_9BIFI|nr:PLP-dependent aminotransferase family protein [Bifidobacterium stellenboschense]KFI97045.1 GntR family transcriptional regulator [Bifidobacterium stellenboschense]
MAEYSALFRRLDAKSPFSSGNDIDPIETKLLPFDIGIPDLSLLPGDDYARAAAEVFGGPRFNEAVSYSAYEGITRLREQVALRRHTNVENVFITTGATQGIFLTISAYVDPGDVVVVENPTFPFALKALRLAGADIRTVPTGPRGLDVDALEELLESGVNVRLVYTVSDFQNPTGVTLSARSKARLLDLAERYDFVIAADSPYRDLWFDQPPAEFPQEERELKDGGHLVEIGSFSKTLGPGWRVGWNIADAATVERFAAYRTSAEVHPSGVAQSIVSTLLGWDGWYDGLVAKQRETYRRKAYALYDTLIDVFGADIVVRRPEGGYFLWAQFPERLDPAADGRRRELARRNVRVVQGDSFYPYDTGSRALRLAFSFLPEEDLIEGSRRIGQSLLG